jgi:inosine triphosphate pyrophosphatase
MTLYFLTGNKNKFNEVRLLLPEIKQLTIDLPELQEFNAKEIIKFKLQEAFKHKKAEFIVEDTSLYFDCLNGLPGPLIKWFVKKIGVNGLFNLTNNFKNNHAKAKTIIGYAKSINEIYFFEGSIKGKIVSPRGKTGFDWDRIFEPNNYSQTFAEMTIEQKSNISMRRLALNKLIKFLEKNK